MPEVVNTEFDRKQYYRADVDAQRIIKRAITHPEEFKAFIDAVVRSSLVGDK